MRAAAPARRTLKKIGVVQTPIQHFFIFLGCSVGTALNPDHSMPCHFRHTPLALLAPLIRWRALAPCSPYSITVLNYTIRNVITTSLIFGSFLLFGQPVGARLNRPTYEVGDCLALLYVIIISQFRDIVY